MNTHSIASAASRTGRALFRGLAAAALIATAAGAWLASSNAAERAVTVPPPAFDPPVAATSQTAVFAGGCFWGVQGVFQHVRGVSQAVSGYAGGEASTAQYSTVETGTTGHAESVRITYDPSQVKFGQLLHIFFAVVHDPTELNRQGPDVGNQYRSAIFPQSDAQQKIADAYVAQLNQAKVFDAPVVTRTDRDSGFFPAEDYHQDYLNSNPTAPYIAINDMPKLDGLKQLFPDLYREQPVLVHAQTG